MLEECAFVLGHQQLKNYLNQCWVIVKSTHRNKLQWIWIKLHIFFKENKFENICKCWSFCSGCNVLTHWGQVMHICVSKLTIIGSDNGLSPSRRQAIIWTNAGILLIRPSGTNFSEILIKIEVFSFKKMHLKMSSAFNNSYITVWLNPKTPRHQEMSPSLSNNLMCCASLERPGTI